VSDPLSLEVARREMLYALAPCAPLQAILQAMALFDPVAVMGQLDMDDPADLLLSIVRDYLRSEYGQIAWRMVHERIDQDEIGRELVAAINEIFHTEYDLDDIDFVAFGVPHPTFGIGWTFGLKEDYGVGAIARDGIRDVIDLFDGDIDEGEFNHELVDRFMKQLRPRFNDDVYSETWAFIGWVFAMSGNTLLDSTQEELAELGVYERWSRDAVANMLAIIEEAEEMHAQALKACGWMENNEAYAAWLRGAVEEIRNGCEFGWPDIGSLFPDERRAAAGDGPSAAAHPDDLRTRRHCPAARRVGQRRVRGRSQGRDRRAVRRHGNVHRIAGRQYAVGVAARRPSARGRVSSRPGHRPVAGRIGNAYPRPASAAHHGARGHRRHTVLSSLRHQAAA
jgi:hypothetical protein